MSDIELVAAFLRRIDEAAAERVVETRFGRAFLHPSLPLVPAASILSLDPACEAEAEEVDQEARRVGAAVTAGSAPFVFRLVERSNARAQRLYERLGFAEVGSIWDFSVA